MLEIYNSPIPQKKKYSVLILLINSIDIVKSFTNCWHFPPTHIQRVTTYINLINSCVINHKKNVDTFLITKKKM